MRSSGVNATRYTVPPILLPGPIRPAHTSTDDRLRVITANSNSTGRRLATAIRLMRDTRYAPPTRVPSAACRRHSNPRTPARSSRKATPHLLCAPLGAEIPPPVFFVGSTSSVLRFDFSGASFPFSTSILPQSTRTGRILRRLASRRCNRPPVYAWLCLRASESRWI
ncbi:hypothetical protein B0H11DRAFT_205424 [Mycena galericulata]|nr:hypothetical protein B0H11DRAFT_205424 [Mycena galericulata]